MKNKGKSLLEKLTEYNKTTLPMHMPGHKRCAQFLGDDLPYAIDITEIDGFDNLHDMNGVLKETSELCKRCYGAKHSFPLVNGSTVGILSAVYALCPFSSHVLIARNCHRSVYNAVELRGLIPHYLAPETDELGVCGKITGTMVCDALKSNPEISLVIITSPTYEGVVSDIAEISEVCRHHGAFLLVDSAHGAHLGFSPDFPENPVLQGADVVVMSLHKTMPSLTQTALLHICSNRVDKSKISEALSIFETSSPSYVLLASIDKCIREVLKSHKKLFSDYYNNLTSFYGKTKAFKSLCVTHYDDLGKIIISVKNTNLKSVNLASILRNEYKIEVEMVSPYYCLAMSSICDRSENFEKLFNALSEIDKNVNFLKSSDLPVKFPFPEMRETPFSSRNKIGTAVLLEDSIGFEALEYLWAYPPGIPLICPGEIITRELINYAEGLEKSGISVKSSKGFSDKKITVY